jgi:ribosomal protein S2
MRKLARNTVSVAGHIGYHRSNWRPESERFAIGYRAGVLVYNVSNTVFIIKRAFGFVQSLVYKYGKLFTYGIKKYKNNFYVRRFTKLMQIVATRDWRGGYVTNYKRFKKRLRNFRKRFSGVLSFIYDYQNYSLPQESKLMKTPSVSPVDSNSTVEIFSYPVPINSQNSEAPRLLAYNFAWNMFTGLSKRLLSRFRKALRSTKKKGYEKYVIRVLGRKEKAEKRKIKRYARMAWRKVIRGRRKTFFVYKTKKFKQEEEGDYTYHKGQRFITIKGVQKRLKMLKFVRARKRGRKKLKTFIRRVKEVAKQNFQEFLKMAKAGKFWVWERLKRKRKKKEGKGTKKKLYKILYKHKYRRKYKYETKYKEIVKLVKTGRVQMADGRFKNFNLFSKKRIKYVVKRTIKVKLKVKKSKPVKKKKPAKKARNHKMGKWKREPWWKKKKINRQERNKKGKKFWFIKVQRLIDSNRKVKSKYESVKLKLARLSIKGRFTKIYERLKRRNPRLFYRFTKNAIVRAKLQKFGRYFVQQKKLFLLNSLKAKLKKLSSFGYKSKGKTPRHLRVGAPTKRKKVTVQRAKVVKKKVTTFTKFARRKPKRKGSRLLKKARAIASVKRPIFGRRWNRTTTASFSGLYSTIELSP